MKSNSTTHDRIIQRLLESYRTTASGRRVRWDEPGEEDDSPEVQRHNAFLDQQRKRNEWKERLKKKGAVPTKNGKPIFEQPQILDENLQQVMTSFHQHYQSNRSMRFREFILVIADLLDNL